MKLIHTNTLLNVLKLEGDLNWDQLTPLVQKKHGNNKVDNRNIYFNEEEQAKLKSQLPKMEQDSTQIKKWIGIHKRVELCLKRRDTPASEEGQLIAEDILLLSDELFEGSKGLADKFFEVRKSPEKSQDINLYPIQEKVVHFVEQAIQIFER